MAKQGTKQQTTRPTRDLEEEVDHIRDTLHNLLDALRKDNPKAAAASVECPPECPAHK